ncbi:MAG: serine acetyltransferase [Azonexus sp.]|nr:serine acetyltransferase [Azonexus sp.]
MNQPLAPPLQPGLWGLSPAALRVIEISRQHLQPDRWQLSPVIRELHDIRDEWRKSHRRLRGFGGREFPSREALRGIVSALTGALFPMRLGPADLRHEDEDAYIADTLDSALNGLHTQIHLELAYRSRREGGNFTAGADDIVRRFAAELPEIRRKLDCDEEAAYLGDPAARSVDEVLLCYPGVLAVISHRIAHQLHQLGAPLVARIIAEIAHSDTGIDIHPGARIGNGFFIDHGTGVVIGETAVIGNRVRIYQAVTLGARHFPAEADGALAKGLPRHPIVEDDVVIYAGATLLGRITIGKGATIGGNVWVTRDVAAGSVITQANLQKGDGRE